MNAIAKRWKHDREGTLALFILLTIVLLYLIGMALWLIHEWNVPAKDYRIVDLAGDGLAAKVTQALYRKLFHRDRG